MGNNLYFIADEALRYVKIGVSRNPEGRLHQLQAGSPLRLHLFCVVPDIGKQVEEAIHQRFAKHWLHREWFSFDPEIHAFIDVVCDHGMPELASPIIGKVAWDEGQQLSKYEVMDALRSARAAAQ